VPLFIAFSASGMLYSLLLSFVCHTVFFIGVFKWIFLVSGYGPIHHVAFAVWFFPFFTFLGLSFNLISRRWGVSVALCLSPCIWIFLEFIRSNISFMSLPWPLLAHSQYQHPVIIQIASFTGAYGISFLIVFVNAVISVFVLKLLCRLEGYKKYLINVPPIRGVVGMVVVATTLTCFALLYGKMMLSKPAAGKLIRASVVQGNIEQTKKWDPKYADFIMKTYIDLSNEGSKDRPDLIIWPEAATPGHIVKNAKHWKDMISLIKQTNTHYLIGSTESPKFQKDTRRTKKYGNTALFFSPAGKLLGQYLKIRLLPFSEYIPCNGIIDWPDFIVPEDRKNSFLQGNAFTLFEIDGAEFGVAICWENVFPDLVRNFCREGAQFMVNITNEARFGTTGPYQFLSMSVFRAVENRVAIARAGNTGVSCFIDPYGRVTGRVQDGGKDVFVRGYLTQDIPVTEQRTFYTMYGDVFAYVCIIVTIVMVVLSIFRKPRQH